MFRGRAFVDVAAHRLWKMASSVAFALWLRTGVRPRFLSSKGQDRWLIREVFPGRRRGFFVEVGAGNGFIGSDSFVLERDYAWNGICVEANPFLYRDLTEVVKRDCLCVEACVDRAHGTVEFVCSGDTSGIVAGDTDNSIAVRGSQLIKCRNAKMIRALTTTTIADILDAHHAPSVIDYVSIDVEGAEERIIETFPFSRYRVLAMTVERPTSTIHEILSAAGFSLVKYRWHDGFYVQRDIWFGGVATPRFGRKAF